VLLDVPIEYFQRERRRRQEHQLTLFPLVSLTLFVSFINRNRYRFDSTCPQIGSA
jgi:hypothetical protein